VEYFTALAETAELEVQAVPAVMVEMVDMEATAAGH
jgi:hypothetical protein